jgi:hypothetical protein
VLIFYRSLTMIWMGPVDLPLISISALTAIDLFFQVSLLRVILNLRPRDETHAPCNGGEDRPHAVP